MVAENQQMTAFKKLEGKRYTDGIVFALRPVGEHFAKTNKSPIEPVSFDPIPVEHTCGMSRKAVSDDVFKKFEAGAKDFLKTDEAKAIYKKWDMPYPY